MFKYLALLVGLMCALPSLLEYLFRVEFKVHDAGSVLVTGASSGIGKDACLHLASLQSFTLYCGVRKEADAEMLTRESGGKVTPVILDVTKQDDVRAVTKTIQESGVPLVGLVNNAGVQKLGAVELQPVSSLRWGMDVNFFGVVQLTQAVLPMLRATQGRIINVGSISGGMPAMGGWGMYASTKFALEAFNDALRQEVNPHGVSVSLISPGFVTTKMGDKFNSNPPETGEMSLSAASELYPNVYGKWMDNWMANALRLSETTDATTTPAIEQALTSPFPKTRYAVANCGGSSFSPPCRIPAWFTQRLLLFLPDRIGDIIRRL